MTLALFSAFGFFDDCAQHRHHFFEVFIVFFVFIRPFTFFGLFPFRVLTVVSVVVLINPLRGAIALAVRAILFRLFTPPTVNVFI